jgi:peptidoglycan/LPS O-acetylase OafA/YrhL
MYLFQFPIWWLSISMMIGLRKDLVLSLQRQTFPATTWLFIADLATLIAVSVLCSRYFETPIRAYIRRRLSG